MNPYVWLEIEGEDHLVEVLDWDEESFTWTHGAESGVAPKFAAERNEGEAFPWEEED